jgi:hypothetical protein
MKPSERKQKLVEELTDLHKALNVEQIYRDPEHKATKDWLAETASVLKQLDESDYQELVRLSKIINPSIYLPKRKEAAHEIDNFIRRKVAEWKRYDFSSLDKQETATKKTGFNYWNVINPFWLLWKMLLFIWHHKLITAAIAIIGLLGIDYSLAWKNTLWLMNAVRGFIIK